MTTVSAEGIRQRTYDATGIPFHEDGRTIIKERIYLDKKDPNTLYDEITVVDHRRTIR
jgi:hypothetical protein